MGLKDRAETRQRERNANRRCKAARVLDLLPADDLAYFNQWVTEGAHKIAVMAADISDETGTGISDHTLGRHINENCRCYGPS